MHAAPAPALRPHGPPEHAHHLRRAALGRVSQDVADRALDVLLEHGINHIDVAASYGDAELRVAPWLKRYPGRFFVATKTGKRRADEAREELHRSLDRTAGRPHRPVAAAQPVRSDRVGHARSARAARSTRRSRRAKQGLVRFDRRHRPRRADRGHPPPQPAALRLRLGAAALQLHDRPVELLPRELRCAAGDLPGAQRGGPDDQVARLPATGWVGRAPTSTWYQPLEDQADIDLAVHWALGRAGHLRHLERRREPAAQGPRRRRAVRAAPEPTRTCSAWSSACRWSRCSSNPGFSSKSRVRGVVEGAA